MSSELEIAQIESTQLNEDEVNSIAGFFEVLAKFDLEDHNQQSPPATKGHQAQINLALTKP